MLILGAGAVCVGGGAGGGVEKGSTTAEFQQKRKDKVLQLLFQGSF